MNTSLLRNAMAAYRRHKTVAMRNVIEALLEEREIAEKVKPPRVSTPRPPGHVPKKKAKA